jgi:hypothetical protein
MREQFAKLSRGHDQARAFNCILKRWASFTLHEDGCLCLSNDAAERGLRGSSWAEIVAVLRIRSWRTSSCCHVPPDRHAKMNGVDPQAWLMDIIARIAVHPVRRPTNYYPRIGSRIRDLRSSGKTTHVNKVHHVTTITQIAKDLGDDEDWLRGVFIEMEIEIA